MAGTSWTNQVQNLIIVAGTGTSGVFVYDPTAGAGNLIASLTDAAKDPYGDPTVKGVSAYVKFLGDTYAVSLNQVGAGGVPGFLIVDLTNPAFSPGGLVSDTNSGAASTSLLSGTQTNVDVGTSVNAQSQLNSGVTNGYVVINSGLTDIGFTPTLSVNDVAGCVTWHQELVSPPPSPGAGFSLYSVQGSAMPAAITLPGYSGTIPLTASDTTTYTVTASTFTRLSNTWPVPANDNSAKTIYRLTAWGDLTTPASALQACRWRMNAFGQPVAQVSIAAAALAAGTTYDWSLTGIVQIISTGNSGTMRAKLSGSLGADGANLIPGNTGSQSAGLASITDTTTIDTTTSTNITLQAEFAATEVSQQVRSIGNMMEKLAF